MIDVVPRYWSLYLLYKLVFDFILWVSRTTAQFKNNVNEMRNRQQEFRGTKQQDRANDSSETEPPSK